MPPRKQPWFRFYVEMLWDPKVRALPVETRWLWATVLGLARSSPIPGFVLLTERQELSVEQMSDAAAIPASKVKRGIEQLSQLMLIERDETVGAWRVVKWNERQFESDDTAVRTAKHRSKERSNGVARNNDGTPQIQRQRTETDTEGKSPLTPAERGNPRSLGTNPRAIAEAKRKEHVAEVLSSKIVEIDGEPHRLEEGQWVPA